MASRELDAVVAPFRGAGSGLGVAIEDATGSVLVAAGTREGAGASRHPIAEGPLAGGAVTVWSDGSKAGAAGADASALADAVGAALAAALGATVHVPAPTRSDDGHARLLESELAHGRRLQRSFVSLEPPPVPGWDIASHYEAAREVGGDFFELFRTRRRGRPLAVVIADVTGKGIAAALLMAFSRPLLHAAIDHTRSPREALERTNRILVEERRSPLFITALVARLDIRTGRFEVANAGHEPPLIARVDGSPIECLAGAGPLIGAFPDLELPEVATVLNPGDLLVLYTDGVTDARSPDGERFDERRLFATVEAVRDRPAAEVVAAIDAAIDAFQDGAEVADDVTIVAIRRLP